MSQSSKITRNVLSGRQKHQLIGWITTEAVRIRPLGAAVAATAASTSLGFRVEPTNLRSAASDAGLDLFQRPEKPESDESKFAILAQAIIELSESLGISRDPRLTKIAGSKQACLPLSSKEQQ